MVTAYTPHVGSSVHAETEGDVVKLTVGTLVAEFTEPGEDAVTVTVILVIENVVESDEPEWFVSPAYVYDADAVPVPTAVLPEYNGDGVDDRPPAPVTATEHGVSAEPVYVTDAGHVTTVDDDAWAIVTAAVASVLNT